MKLRLAVFALCALAVSAGPARALDPYDSPLITCESSGLSQITLKVCGGANTGALAGVTVQYKKRSDWQLSGWADDGTLCNLSLSGQPSLQYPDRSRWELQAGECASVIIGDLNFDETGVSGNECAVSPLECGTEYVFRSFAHAGRRMGRSDWTADLTCSTRPCEEGCTFTQGYWGTHGPGDCQKGNNSNVWPASSLTLGSVAYTAEQICSILDANPANGNGLIALAHQLIAAKFNVLSGAPGSCVISAISAADNLIGNLVIPPVGGGFVASSTTSALTLELDQYNSGELLCAGHCDNPSGVQRNSAAQGERATWGKIKTIYR